MYWKGIFVKKDFPKAALILFSHALKQKISAYPRIGLMYAHGRGVVKDIEEANFWFYLAKDMGALENSDPQIVSQVTSIIINTPKHIADKSFERYKRLTPADKRNYIKRKFTQYIGPKLVAKRKIIRKKQPPKSSSGTAFVISTSGYLLTNNHVIRGCKRLSILKDGKSIVASVVDVDRKFDLALLKANMKFSSAAYLNKFDEQDVGENVLVIGFPFGNLLSSEIKISTGIISSSVGLKDDKSMFQLSASVQSGNSGGPVLNEYGEVVGVVSSKVNALKVARVTGDIPENMAFAIKLRPVRELLRKNNISYNVQSSTDRLSAKKIFKKYKNNVLRVDCSY